jgi:hypothetical protein
MVKATEVRDAFSKVPDSNIDVNSVGGDNVMVTVSENQAGSFFRTLRINDFDFTSRRVENTVVARIEVEELSTMEKFFG